MVIKYNIKFGFIFLYLSMFFWLFEVIVCMNYFKIICKIIVLEIKNYFNYDKFKILYIMNINVVLMSCFIF